jgi:hypothetical protein
MDHGTSQARGTAISIPSVYTFEIKKCKIYNKGRYIFIDITHG